MVSELHPWSSPPSSCHKTLFSVIFDPPSFLITHSIITHLWRLAKLEKKFVLFLPPRASSNKLQWTAVPHPFIFGDISSVSARALAPTGSKQQIEEDMDDVYESQEDEDDGDVLPDDEENESSPSASSVLTVLVAEKLGEAGLKLPNVDCSYNLSPEELCTKISLCDALIVRSGTKVTCEVFKSSAERLKVVGRADVRIDNVELAAATEHGCLVVNAPTANTVVVAEHEIALLAAMARNVAQAYASVKAGKWQRNKYVGVSLVGKTLAVLGFGKFDSEVARRAKGLGMNVIAHDSYALADRARAIGVELVSFDEAIANVDFISLFDKEIEDALHLFDKLPVRNDICWNTLIVLGAVFARIAMGTTCDLVGPRLASASLILLTAPAEYFYDRFNLKPHTVGIIAASFGLAKDIGFQVDIG